MRIGGGRGAVPPSTVIGADTGAGVAISNATPADTGARRFMASLASCCLFAFLSFIFFLSIGINTSISWPSMVFKVNTIMTCLDTSKMQSGCGTFMLPSLYIPGLLYIRADRSHIYLRICTHIISGRPPRVS